MNAPAYTLAQIKLVCPLFFAPDTLEHWRSIVNPEVYQGPGGVFFVTSEQENDNAPRLFKVREFRSATCRVITDQHETQIPATTLEHAQNRARRRAANVDAPAAVYA